MINLNPGVRHQRIPDNIKCGQSMEQVHLGTPKRLVVEASPLPRHDRNYNSSAAFRGTIQSGGRDSKQMYESPSSRNSWYGAFTHNKN